MIPGTITVYTEDPPKAIIITNLSTGHYGVWSTKDGVFDWQGEFFRANLVIDKPMSFGTIA